MLVAVELVSVVLAVELTPVALTSDESAIVELATVAFEAESLGVVEFARAELLSVDELASVEEAVLLSELDVVAFVDDVKSLELEEDSVELLEADVVVLSVAVDVEVEVVSLEVELSEVDSPVSFLWSVNLLRPPASASPVVELSVEVLLVVEALAVELVDVDDAPLESNRVGKSTPVMINFLVASS